MVYLEGQLGEPEKFHRRNDHLIPHQNDGTPWRLRSQVAMDPTSRENPKISIFDPKFYELNRP